MKETIRIWKENACSRKGGLSVRGGTLLCSDPRWKAQGRAQCPQDPRAGSRGRRHPPLTAEPRPPEQLPLPGLHTGAPSRLPLHFQHHPPLFSSPAAPRARSSSCGRTPSVSSERLPWPCPAPPRPSLSRPGHGGTGKAVPGLHRRGAAMAALLRPRQREPETAGPRRRRRGPLGRVFPLWAERVAWLSVVLRQARAHPTGVLMCQCLRGRASRWGAARNSGVRCPLHLGWSIRLLCGCTLRSVIRIIWFDSNSVAVMFIYKRCPVIRSVAACCFPAFSRRGSVISYAVLGARRARCQSLLCAVPRPRRVWVCTGPARPCLGKTTIVLSEISYFIVTLQWKAFSASHQFSFVSFPSHVFPFKTNLLCLPSDGRLAQGKQVSTASLCQFLGARYKNNSAQWSTAL